MQRVEKCVTKACVLPAYVAGLCKRCYLMQGGDRAFASKGHRATEQTETEVEHKRKYKRAHPPNRKTPRVH